MLRAARLPLVLLATVAGGANGCAAASDDEPTGVDADESAQPVIGGTVTRERSEVGRVTFPWGGWCTATLVGPRVAITAAHCVDYQTRLDPGKNGWVMIEPRTKGDSRSGWTLSAYRRRLAPDVAVGSRTAPAANGRGNARRDT